MYVKAHDAKILESSIGWRATKKDRKYLSEGRLLPDPYLQDIATQPPETVLPPYSKNSRESYSNRRKAIVWATALNT